MKREYNQYGDVIFTPEQEQILEQFKNSYEAGWEYQAGDPQYQMQEDDFINSYIVHFKEQRDKEWDAKQEAKQRQQNFMQKLVKKIINKGKDKKTGVEK